MSRYREILFCTLCLLSLSPLFSSAQTTTATVAGLIADESGGAIPGAEVVIINMETGVRRSAKGDDAGRYRIPQLPPGVYEASVTMAGFETTVRQGMTLQVGQEISLNFTMKVGAVTEQVTVVGEAPLVDTSTSAVTGVVEAKRITDLPLNGRDFTQLALVQPGVFSLRSTASSSQKGFGTRISIAGTRPEQTAWLLDGSNIRSFSNFGTPGNAGGAMNGVDAVREFQVLTSNYGAEFGGSGGVINMVTRSGTNQVHGTVYEFLRNDVFDARNFFDRVKPSLTRNQFGGSLGGPVHKDRTFIFGNYEGLRQIKGNTSIAFVPDANAHRGTLPDGPVQLAASTRPFLDVFPLPNGPSIGGGLAQLITQKRQATRDDYFLVRADHHLSDAQTLFGRFTFDQSHSDTPNDIPVWTSIIEVPTRYASVGYDRVLSPTFLSASRIAYNRTRIGSLPTLLIDAPKNLYVFSDERPPSITFTGGTTLFAGLNDSFDSVLNLYEVAQAFSTNRGSQSWKFGFSYTRQDLNARASSKRMGLASWPTLRSFLSDGTLEEMEVGVPGTTTARSMRQSVYGAYFQDDWKIRPSLTINLGVRYEPFSAPSEKWGRNSTVADWRTASEYNYGPDVRVWNSPAKKYFSPRFGFAWDVKGNGKTAVRGGFGMFYPVLGPPFYRSAVVKNPPYAGNIELPDGNNLASAPAYIIANGPSRLSAKMIPDKTTFDTYQKDQDSQYEMKANLTVQRELGANMAVSVGYVGSRSIHLWSQMFANAVDRIMVNGRPFVPAGAPRPNPKTGPGLARYTNAQAFYNGLQLEMKKRFSHGLQFQTSYTFSKNIDNSTTGSASSDFNEGPSSQPYDLNADRGLSALHQAQNLVINGSYLIPSPIQSGAGNYLLSGWQVNSIFTAAAGTPFQATVSGTNAPDRGPTTGSQHPDLVAGRSFQSLATGQPNGWIDTTAFTLPPAGFYGNAGRNIIPGPGVLIVDLSLMKTTPIGRSEARRMEFRADFFNLGNRSNFASPPLSRTRVFNASNRRPVAGVGILTNTSTTSRQLQFSLKLVF